MKRNRAALLLAFSCLWISSLLHQASCADKKVEDHFLYVNDQRDNNDKFTLYASLPTTLEATVDVQATTTNMSTNRPLPMTVDVSRRASDTNYHQDILEFTKQDPRQKFEFHYHYHAKHGVRGGRHDDTIVYDLPYERGKSCKINQGYLGTFSHNAGSNSDYALDFGLPLSSAICAAREGIVIAVRDDSTVGGNNKDLFEEAANYIIIKHSDGSYANYAHIAPRSASVSLGQAVARKQVIARVGETGFVTCPHLHFDVSLPIDGSHRRCVPTRFRSTDGIVSLEEGHTYTSQ